MATYIKGVTDVIPDQQGAKVDWKVISSGLTALQGRYNKGFDQVKGMYNSLINSALSSSDNEQFRQEYLKKADQYLTQMAGVDLANPNNVMQATQVFDPLVNDKQYVRDIYLTKIQQNEMGKMSSAKNSTDKELRAQYNPIMEQYLGIGQERLSQMKRDDGSIEAARPNMYTPWENPIDWASNVAKEQGLEFKYDYNAGLYKVTEINGGKSLGNYNTWFRNTISNRFDNQFRIESEVRVDQAVKGLMSQDPTLNKNSALQKLAGEYSTTYTKNYNQEINDVQAALDDLDKGKRELQKKYPSGIPPQIANQLTQAKKQKDSLFAKLTQMKTEKGSDEEFTKKAIDLFINNPAGAYTSSVRSGYAEQFANKQAFGKVSKTQEADEVQLRIHLQEDSQAHDWAIKEQDFRNQRILNNDKFKYDLTLADVKGELLGSTGATLGPVKDIGTYETSDYYNAQVSDLFSKGTQPFINDKVLAVAANLTIGASGTIDFKATDDIQLPELQQAIERKGKNMDLTENQENALKKYLEKLLPGNNLIVRNMRFPAIQGIITDAIRKNSQNDPTHGKVALEMVNNANNARYQFGQMWAQANTHLKDLVIKDRSYLDNEYVKANRDGSMSINYAKINGLDKDDKEAVYRQVIPQYQTVSAETAKQSRVIKLTPSEKNYDYSIYQNVIINAEKIGVTNAEGEFVEYDEEQTADFKNKTGGIENISKVFDQAGEFELKMIDGVKYIKATIPVIRDATKNESMATKLDFDLNNEIEKNNKVEILIPANKAMNIVGNDRVVTNRVTGGTMVIPNKLRTLMEESLGTSLLPEPKSWVTQGTLENGGKTYFPSYLKTNIAGGFLYSANNDILAKFETDAGESKILNITNSEGITLDMLKSNPNKYDIIIRKYIENGLNTYGQANIQYKHNQINNNRVEGQTNSSWTKWKDINW